MTKYVLNSGGVKNSPDKGRMFFHEVLQGLGTQPRLLICNFAQLREDWEEKYTEDVNFFEEIFNQDIKPVLNLAFPETFGEQMQESDAVYIHGGDDHLVQYWLKQFDLKKLWDGKVVAANSAGSNAIVESFWTCDWRQCMDGLGLLPIKFLPHFQSDFGINDPRGPIDWDEAYNKLEQHGDQSLPIYALEEGEYIAFEV